MLKPFGIIARTVTGSGRTGLALPASRRVSSLEPRSQKKHLAVLAVLEFELLELLDLLVEFDLGKGVNYRLL